MTRRAELVALLSNTEKTLLELQEIMQISAVGLRQIMSVAIGDGLLYVSHRGGSGGKGRRYTSSPHLALPVQPTRKEQPERPFQGRPVVLAAVLKKRSALECAWMQR